jgi:plastocyanin
MQGRILGSVIVTGVLAVTLNGCGGSSPSSPSPNPGGGGGGVQTTTINITGSGVDNKTIQVAVGAQVTFINGSNSVHEISSNPHPAHTDCPALNIGPLNPGEQRMTQALTTARTCGYHDHQNPGDSSLQGSIIIQ